MKGKVTDAEDSSEDEAELAADAGEEAVHDAEPRDAGAALHTLSGTDQPGTFDIDGLLKDLTLALALVGPGWRWLALVLIVGLIAGFAQTLRGAHHPSHTLWTLVICTGISISGWLLGQRWLGTKTQVLTGKP